MPLKLRVGWLVVGNEKVASKFEFEIYDGPCDECIFPSSSACDISNIPKSISFCFLYSPPYIKHKQRFFQ